MTVGPSPDDTTRRIVSLRATLFRAVREFFDRAGFVEVDTPALVPSPGLDLHLDAFEVFDPEGASVGWLSTSPEYQMKRLLCAGETHIYQIARSYRANELGVLHEREFTMLEWYRADATSADVMRDTEALVAHVVDALAERSDLVVGPIATAWPRLTVAEVFARYAGRPLESIASDYEFYRVWVDAVQPALGDRLPLFVTDWPASMASLARLNPDGTADRFEAFWKGVELCNGFGELTDPTEQRRRFEDDRAQRRAEGKPVYPIDEHFIDALETGMPESGGNALGIDRLLMLLLGVDAIQDVMPFPAGRL